MTTAKPLQMALISVVIGLLAWSNLACGKKGDKLCKEAAARYTGCVAEILGQEMADMARSKQADGIKACSADKKTQAMYEKCLPGAGCQQFMECLESYARETGSTPAAAGASRKEQCEHHVREGLRGVAMQTVMLSDDRDDASKRTAQMCVLDESKDFHGCLSDKERASVQAHGVQRQRDCEGWEPALAACILDLPEARDCNPDEYPFWREPIDEGKAGPAVAWSIDVAEPGDEEPWLRWAEGGILIIANAGALRGIRDGKELWRARAPDGWLDEQGAGIWPMGKLVAVGGLAAGDTGDTGEGDARAALVMLDVETGRELGSALAATELVALAPAGKSSLMALAESGQLFRITPGECVKRGSKRCAVKLAAVPKEAIPYRPILAPLSRGLTMVGSLDSLAFYDIAGNFMMSIALREYGAQDVAAVPPDKVAVIDDGGAALLSVTECARAGRQLYLPSTVHLDPDIQTPRDPPEGCESCELAPSGCVAAYQVALNSSGQTATPIGDGAIAFNDHGFIESTRMLGSNRQWKVKTGGQGQAAGDTRYVYTVSFGHDGEGPVRLLALARDSGDVAWHSDLGKEVPKTETYDDVGAVVRGGWLAARIATRVHALELPR